VWLVLVGSLTLPLRRFFGGESGDFVRSQWLTITSDASESVDISTLLQVGGAYSALHVPHGLRLKKLHVPHGLRQSIVQCDTGSRISTVQDRASKSAGFVGKVPWLETVVGFAFRPSTRGPYLPPTSFCRVLIVRQMVQLAYKSYRTSPHAQDGCRGISSFCYWSFTQA
jgi:hypothetical protein